MCRVLKVSRSGFYAWCNRPESSRTVDNIRLDIEIRAMYHFKKGRYGSVKITKELRKKGLGCSRSRVARRMKNMGLRAKTVRKFKVTTDSKHSFPVAPNLLNRQFSVERKNQVLVSDITYIPSKVGWLYLTVVIDLFSRMVVGWNLSASLAHEGALAALHQAIWRRKPPKGTMFHSDRGVQFACNEFRKALKRNHFIQSMSRKGDCWDNAVAESFFRTLKMELVYHVNFLDKEHAQRELFEYIEIFYNRQRIHATLDYLSPAEFESVKLAKCA